ncbi:FmdE family protein [Aliarcobacter butzleri]|uniref:FmdE family protein n=1 Tax=Aliarcobacter butzleri TaxID=28197 RepID=UPI0021B4716C|nr:FmdE family protein [Aliarcobacter butzleri]MCT7536858.1 FmdE family protein [Aliarcobacter butzleri]MCT7624224.1 FmdE family protein [Aliarcobacter butzleri]
MIYPQFFNKIPTIKLQDDLASFLGAFEDGLIEFSYLDVVKSAGHSCPTVLGAYLMTLKGLEVLYKNEIPKRGEILVEFKEAQNVAVAGVIGNVIMNITGATTTNGFKGLAGKYDRNHLMKFEQDINGANVRFTRVDTLKSVDVFYDASSIKPYEDMNFLMQKSLQGNATNEEKKEFAKLWQKRVEDISNNINEVIKIDIKE